MATARSSVNAWPWALVPGQHPGVMVNGEGAVGMAQDFNLPLDAMAAVLVRRDWQGQPLKLYAVIFAHRSFKMFAEHIVQVVPELAEGMPLSRQATKADPGSRGGWVNSAL